MREERERRRQKAEGRVSRDDVTLNYAEGKSKHRNVTTCGQRGARAYSASHSTSSPLLPLFFLSFLSQL
jgi:hypothetical protein